jgi:SAM-dependent methyltransferase
MASDFSQPVGAQGFWCCPICKSTLFRADIEVVCTNDACRSRFPIVAGVPILLNESSSLFSIKDLCDQYLRAASSSARLQSAVIRQFPSNSRNSVATRNYKWFARLLLEERASAKVLVIGGGIVGQGMDALLRMDEIELIETDVAFGPRTQLICDAHDLPFTDGSFDGVIIQAVLEHVVDPYRCVEEIHRVLTVDGLVYVETPFMQQVHLGRYDFTRFTHLGHRRLFRTFDEIDSGLVAGPGTVLAWSYEYFLLSFVRRRLSRGLVKAFARVTGFWLKYLDALVAQKPGALDAASGFYFLGRKSQYVLPDRELIALYRGAQGVPSAL